MVRVVVRSLQRQSQLIESFYGVVDLHFGLLLLPGVAIGLQVTALRTLIDLRAADQGTGVNG
jgi:hypothetical protein